MIVAIGIFAVLFAGSVAVLILGDESSTSESKDAEASIVAV